MRAVWKGITGVFLLLPCGSEGAESPELSVGDATLQPGATGVLAVHGHIGGDSTFGVTVMAQILPRAGNTGTVVFTPAPPVDVVQLGDAWEGTGAFNAFDTDSPGFFATLNGAVDESGGVHAPVTFDGALTGFPIVASEDAEGTWDVVLATSAENSGWVDLATTLTPGTITVFDPAEIPAVSEWGMVVLAALLLTAGTLAAGRRLHPHGTRTARVIAPPSEIADQRDPGQASRCPPWLMKAPLSGTSTSSDGI